MENKGKTPARIKQEERDHRIRERYKELMSIPGYMGTQAIHEISLEEECTMKKVWGVLGQAGLTGKNRIKTEVNNIISQPA